MDYWNDFEMVEIVHLSLLAMEVLNELSIFDISFKLLKIVFYIFGPVIGLER